MVGERKDRRLLKKNIMVVCGIAGGNECDLGHLRGWRVGHMKGRK